MVYESYNMIHMICLSSIQVCIKTQVDLVLRQGEYQKSVLVLISSDQV